MHKTQECAIHKITVVVVVVVFNNKLEPTKGRDAKDRLGPGSSKHQDAVCSGAGYSSGIGEVAANRVIGTQGAQLTLASRDFESQLVW